MAINTDFDLTYDYDIYSKYIGYLLGSCSLKDYVNSISMQQIKA